MVRLWLLLNSKSTHIRDKSCRMTAGASRRVHLEQRVANDGHMVELARKAH